MLPDLVGFGRSDKPMERGWYSYDRHVEMAATLLEDLDLRDATFVVHDWGGPIGLRLAVEHPERVARLVILDSGVFNGESPMNDDWQPFAAFVERTEDLPIGFLVRRGCHRDPGDEVAAAYDAPFPSIASKAGARAFPGLIPQTPDAPGAAAGPAGAGGAARGRAADADAVGRRGPGAAAAARRGVRRRARPALAPPHPRGGALPAGGPGPDGRRGDRRLARLPGL